jgi:pimeloyl-ACP methyl ester carboxylesterase
MADPGFVLVHGGYHASQCWDRLRPLLHGEVRAVDLPRGPTRRQPPGVALSDWTEAVVEEVDAATAEQLVVVGHSLAGVFLPAVVAQRAARVAHLVLVAGVVPPEGRTQRQNLPWAGRIGARLQTRDGVLRPPPRWLARSMFCNDMDRRTREWTLRGLVPEAASVFDEPVFRQGLPRATTSYVRLRRDRAVTKGLAKRQIANYGGPVEVLELDAGHDVMISQPEALARILNAVATGRSGRLHNERNEGIDH